jgi:hypothetical protein
MPDAHPTSAREEAPMTKATPVLPCSEERRQFPRYQIHHGKNPHLIAHLLDAEWWPAQVLDLSKGGISLYCDRRPNPGEVVTLNLHHIPHQFVRELPVRVVLATEVLGAFLLGAEFTRELTDEETAGLL